ncbi:NADH-quinone oxidoreductase subunit B family protein [Thermovibrio sp.]
MKIGIVGLTGCSGCQCEVLNCQEPLLKLLSLCDISFFPLVKDGGLTDRLDIVFVEGSVSTDKDEKLLKEIRRNTEILVAMGTCACFGGVQAQRNDEVSLEEMLEEVYSAKELPVKVFKPKPLSEVVPVDYQLPGCPIDKREFIYTVSALLNGVKPFFPSFPVCHECKLEENECLLLEGFFCQGPITSAGCGAPCTSQKVGCHGCRGDFDFPNYRELYLLASDKLSFKDFVNSLKIFRGNSFKKELLRREYEEGA